ncbi:restriction endonuclease S subunit [Pedobacter sp. AK013]|nr:restriction endonuclease S subunit [Pedobacter sp. AK013]
MAGFEYSKYITYQNSGEIMAVRGLNVKEGKIKPDNAKYIDRNTSDLLPRSKLFKNDVVMTYIGVNIGDVALIEKNNKYHLAPNVAKITPNDANQLSSVYLLHYLMYNQREITRHQTNTAKQALNMENIREIPIPVPDINLQHQFAKVFLKVDALKENSRKRVAASERLYFSISQKGFEGTLNLIDFDVESLKQLHEAKQMEPLAVKAEKLTKKPARNKSKLIWEEVSVEKAANWIKEKYTGFHFTTEMLVRFLKTEYSVFPDYYSSEELKMYPQLNEASDLKSLIFSAVHKENSFLKLNQFFYDAKRKKNQLYLTTEDADLLKERSDEERSGIYFSIEL